MASPIPYTRGTSFTDAQAADPVAPLSGPGVDAEYDRILITINSLITALAEIQRADGALANGSVGADQISPDVYTGLYPAEPWLTGTEYALNRTVLVSGATIKLYRCLESHESSVFANDLAAGYWVELADFTPPAVAGTVPISQGGTGGVTATEARTNLGLGYLATLMTAPIPVSYGGTGGITAVQARASLGVGIGTQVQAYSSVLDAFAGATLAADKLVYGTGASSVAVTDLTSFARTLLDDADAATARGTLAAMKGNQTTVTDWNDALKDGHYYAAGGASNAPTSDAFVGSVTRFDDNNLLQMASRLDADEVYIRRRLAGTFSSWARLARAAEVPASGLPAPDFESSEITLVSDGDFSVSHGLGALPKLVSAVLVCKSADAGYAVGAELYVAGNSGTNTGMTWAATSSAIVGSFGTAIPVNAIGTTSANITFASWKLVLRAWA